MVEMKTLTLNGVTYEIVDGKARDMIGDLSALESKAETLVEAINLAMKSGGSGTVDKAEVERIVAAYLAANPPAAGEPGNDGADGAPGQDGADGEDGQDGFSPTVSVQVITGGHRITITDVNGPKSFDVMDGVSTGDGSGTGSPGAPGADGKDGVSPTISTAPIEGGTRVTITDVNGEQSFDIMNGVDGQPGADGQDGSPGKDGAPGTPGRDGNDGAPGADGFSPTVTVEIVAGGHRVSITDATGTKSFDVLNGKDGADGAPGRDGQDGAPGEDGKTPVKGVDYFTSEEIEQVAQQAASMVEVPEVSIDQLDAEKVVFSADLLTTTAIGNIKLTNGQATIPAAGKNLKQVWDTIFVQEKNPATTQPSVAITFNQAKAYEVGTKVTPAYSATLKAGSYTYGPATGVKATSWEVTDTDDNTADTASGSFPELTVSDNTSYKITAKANHGDGAIPLTNTGNEYPAGQIKAGTKSATSGAVTGYRNSFYGTLSEKAALTSGIIRGLAGKSGKALFNGSSFDVSIPVGALRVVIAYPATLRDISSIKDVNGMNAEISSGFTPQTVSVEGANGYQAIDYKVYTMDFAAANDTANTFTVTI